MKKFFVMLLCLMLLVALALPAMAADFNLTATASKTTAYLGDEITITISTSGTTPYTSMGFFLQYDTSVFEYKSRSWGAAIVDANTKSFDPDSGKVTAVWDAADAYSGEMIKITLLVKKATPGNTTITFSDASCKNINDNISVGTNSVQIALACEHSYPKDADGNDIYTQAGSDKHQRTCEKCGTPTTEDHDWNDGVGKPAPTCGAGGTIEYTCLICRAIKTEDVGALEHKYDNDCDSTCNNGCGTTREVSHNYVLVTDKEAHRYKCSCGELKPGSWEKHTPGPAATESSAQVCTVCNYEIAPILSHEHDISTDWYSDSEAHWHRCEKKGCYHVQDKQRHVYDNNCDVTCNVCNAVRKDVPHNFKPELQANAQGHWQVCASCNAKGEVMAHVPGPEATETEPQICTECNFRIKMPLNHVHNYGDTWYSDDDNHWQSCGECTESTELEAHTWDEGKEQDDGSILYTCTVCAKELTLSEPMPSEPETTPTIPASSTPKPTAPAESGGFPWQWAGIAAIVLMVVGIVLLVIEFIRSRKTNMHGKFSK